MRKEHQMLLRDILALAQDFEKTWLGFTYREANKIANYGKNNIFMYKHFLRPTLHPTFLSDALSCDMLGKTEERTLRWLCNSFVIIN